MHALHGARTQLIHPARDSCTRRRWKHGEAHRSTRRIMMPVVMMMSNAAIRHALACKGVHPWHELLLPWRRRAVGEQPRHRIVDRRDRVRHPLVIIIAKARRMRRSLQRLIAPPDNRIEGGAAHHVANHRSNVTIRGRLRRVADLADARMHWLARAHGRARRVRQRKCLRHAHAVRLVGRRAVRVTHWHVAKAQILPSSSSNKLRHVVNRRAGARFAPIIARPAVVGLENERVSQHRPMLPQRQHRLAVCDGVEQAVPIRVLQFQANIRLRRVDNNEPN